MTLATGKRLGHYEVRARIGAGGMGEVYLAEDTRLRRKIALKILPAQVASDHNRMRRFNQEAMAAAALNDPNIAHIYEIGCIPPMSEGLAASSTADQAHFIAMEYIDGETLRKRIQAAPMKITEVLDVGKQISRALSTAHAAGIIHRDIKPENIMIRRDGLVKVLDFGLAKLTEHHLSTSFDTEAPTRIVKTAPGVVMGTAIYMSPEQARGIEVDARTDIFSLGVVLYEMIAGCPPFAGLTAAEVLASIISDKEPQPLARYAREVPAELERIISKALRKNRDERYQTVKDLLLDLQNLKEELDFERKLQKSASSRSDVAMQSGKRSNEAPAPRTVNERSSLRVSLNQKVAVISAAIVLVLLAAAAYVYFGRASRAPIASIAVLPLVNATGDPNMEYLSDGIAESLMNSLSQLPNLKVMSRSSAFHYKGKEQDAQKVGKELNVRGVLSGSLKKVGDQVVISVSLDDALDNHQIWGTQYDRQVSDLLSVEHELARDITRNLQLKLSGVDERRLTKDYTANPEAYQLYLKGRFYWNKRTGDAAKKSIEYFQQAIEKDPNYALGYAGLADAYQLLTLFADKPPQDAFPKARESATRALELDDTLAEAHTSLASTLFFYDRNFAQAQREFQRAIELNPNYATAHHWYGVTYLAKMERFDEAISELKHAQELDPLSLVINADLGNTYIQAREYDKAIEQLRKTIEMDDSFYFAHALLGIAYEMKGDFPDATDEFQKARQLNDDPYTLALLGHVYAVTGRKDEAQRILDQLKQISKQRFVWAYGFALVYAGLGDKDRAFQWLEKSLEDREARITRLKVDPLFDSLRSDPRFGDLIRQVGL